MVTQSPFVALFLFQLVNRGAYILIALFSKDRKQTSPLLSHFSIVNTQQQSPILSHSFQENPSIPVLFCRTFPSDHFIWLVLFCRISSHLLSHFESLFVALSVTFCRTFKREPISKILRIRKRIRERTTANDLAFFIF